ncbi:AAA family ATPase [Nitrogeniibacter aestuarii]|uniref:AAA family ATPase n=1 Tax=Nitrogeniibacter aestuarii TaxID=2815343 RepID=UPI001E2F2078|nr:MoxR family ATPase [Nitrogeniibacter aestuarii]
MNPSKAHTLLDIAGTILLGKAHPLRLSLCCLLAGGHLLIEDVPGVGKTTLAHLMARLPGLAFQRIQFTSDLLPADILGVSIFDRDSSAFRFHPGPVFAQLILADEINRATPKTQSALLEAMEEGQITADGATLPLPDPFFVIATQNPMSQIGTFSLPESQLDRFLMRIELGYPDPAAELALLQGQSGRQRLSTVDPVFSAEDLMQMQQACEAVHVSPPIARYVHALLTHTRHNPDIPLGLSPRAGLGLIAAARAWAWLDERDHVTPEDVQAVFGAVANHRMGLGHDMSNAQGTSQAILAAVAVH